MPLSLWIFCQGRVGWRLGIAPSRFKNERWWHPFFAPLAERFRPIPAVEAACVFGLVIQNHRVACVCRARDIDAYQVIRCDGTSSAERVPVASRSVFANNQKPRSSRDGAFVQTHPTVDTPAFWCKTDGSVGYDEDRLVPTSTSLQGSNSWCRLVLALACRFAGMKMNNRALKVKTHDCATGIEAV